VAWQQFEQQAREQKQEVEWQQAQERERRLEADALARRAIWDMEARRRQLEQQAAPRLSHDDLKQQIHHLVASSPFGMNCQDLARALGLDVSLLRPILHDMVSRGELVR